MFESKLKNYLQTIELNLKRFLPKPSKFCINFSESLNYSTLNGGKRLRPVLTLAVCEMLNGNLKAAVPFACGVEFIHAGSLIHDDLPCMDNSNYRRNRPSCHNKFGETMAVLAADGLFLNSFEIVTKAVQFGLDHKQIVKACAFLSSMAGFNGMVFGQAIDMFIDEKLYNKEALKILSKLKTASLIRSACVLGALAADVDEQTENELNSYAEHLGIAFQICDDILDFEGKSEITGKPTKTDLKNNKLTYLKVFNVEQAKEQAQIQTDIALKIIKKFENSQFLVYLTELMLKRIK